MAGGIVEYRRHEPIRPHHRRMEYSVTLGEDGKERSEEVGATRRAVAGWSGGDNICS